MRNADLDDLKDEQYSEQVKQEKLELAQILAKKLLPSLNEELEKQFAEQRKRFQCRTFFSRQRSSSIFSQ